MNQVVQTLEQQRLLVKLLGFDYFIEYNPGCSNRIADALSRQVEAENSSIVPSLLIQSMSSPPTTSILEEIKAEILHDTDL